jgi:galactokinase
MSTSHHNGGEEPLLQQACEVFLEQFGTRPTAAGVAPGRVNLIGEHTDYNDGFVLPMAIERRTVVVAAPNSSGQCRIVAGSFGNEMVTFTPDASLAPGKTTWANYVMGVVAQFITHGRAARGFDAVIVSDVPLGGGLSSSAALEVATATVVEQLLGITIDPEEKALWCQAAEHEFAGMPCGIMDQFISAMGRADHALLIDCRSQDTRQVRLDDPQVAVLITNSNVKHELAGSEYPTRRKQCESAVQILRGTYPQVTALRDVTMEQLDALRGELDDVVYRRARHVITENDRTTRAADAFDRGDYGQVGRLMYESHRSLREDYEVSCPELDRLVDLAGEVEGVFGSRMTGGGFGGCTVTLVRADALQGAIEHLSGGYRQSIGQEATCFATRAAEGARGLQLG